MPAIHGFVRPSGRAMIDIFAAGQTGLVQLSVEVDTGNFAFLVLPPAWATAIKSHGRARPDVIRLADGSRQTCQIEKISLRLSDGNHFVDAHVFDREPPGGSQYRKPGRQQQLFFPDRIDGLIGQGFLASKRLVIDYITGEVEISWPDSAQAEA